VIVRPFGIVASRLAPYPGWPALRKRAEAAWQAWRRSIKPARPIARLGIRTINRIDVPLDDRRMFPLETYLNFYPQVPDFSSAGLSGFVMQVTLPTSSARWMTTVTSAPATPPPMLNHTSLLLDIDLYRNEGIPDEEPDLWAIIDEARAIKNDIFERCITDETRRLIS
jgi:uncharacterized protein (TIGR04255 family)